MTEGQNDVDSDSARAFRQQVEPEIEVMLRVALSLTRNRADAEDVVQESLLRAYRALDRLRWARIRVPGYSLSSGTPT